MNYLDFASDVKYPLAYSRPLPDVDDWNPATRKLPGVECVLFSRETGPESYFATTKINGEYFDLLVDSGASKTLVSKRVFERIPSPKPDLQHTKKLFQMANGRVHAAEGVIHATITLRFGNYDYTFKMPIFVVDFLPSHLDGLLGADAGYAADLTLALGRSKLYREDDIHRKHPLICKSRPRRDLNAYAHVLERTKIPAGRALAVEIGTRLFMPEKCWGDILLAETCDDIYDETGAICATGIIDMKQMPAVVCVINPTNDDILLRAGTKISELFPIQGCAKKPTTVKEAEEMTGRKNPNMDSFLSRETESIKQGNLPSSMIDIYPASDEDVFSRQEKRKIKNLFGIRSIKCKNKKSQTGPEEDDDSEVSDMEEDMDVMNPPVAKPRKVPLEPNELPEDVQKLLDDCKGILTQEQALAAEEFIRKQVTTFVDPSRPLVGTDAVAHYIDTQNARPIRIPPRRVPPGMRKIIEEEITKMLEQNIIRESDSPWSSPIVLVKKKDNTIRFCIDYRALNKITRGNSYPLPRIEDNLEALKGNSWFCALDMASGYWQIKMADEDREKTAFASHMGLYEFNRMPFGLTNAPATFQFLMEKVLKGYIGTKCLLYLDDIIVYGKTFEEVFQNLKDVFARFDQYNLKLKAKKCKLFQRKVNFLGHVVSEKGIECDPKKIEKIQQIARPKNRSEVRSILGLGNYYRRFIKDYGHLVSPLQRLTRKDVTFLWGEKEQDALENLKKAFCSTPILAFPDFDKEFIIDTDASNFAIGGVLSQIQDGEEKVIMYGSKVLSGSQLRWCTTRRELWAVFYFVTKGFRYYILENHFILRTDHAALRWMRTMLDHTKDLALSRWLGFMQTYFDKMKVEYRKGIDHGNADAMSRLIFRDNTRKCSREDCPDKGHILTEKKRLSMKNKQDAKLLAPVLTRNQLKNSLSDGDCAVVVPFTNEEIKESQKRDSDLSRFMELLSIHTEKPSAKEYSGESSEVRIFCALWDQFKIVDGILYRVGKTQTDTWRLVIPHVMRRKVMELLHNTKWAGHPGMTRMKSSIGSRYFWPKMRQDIESWVKCCQACAMAKRSQGRGKAPLQQELSGFPFQRVAFDVIGPLPVTSKGNRFILVMVDYFSKWAEAYHLPNHTAVTVANTICSRWVATHGCPLRLHCDNAPEFRGHVITQMRDILGVKGTFSTPYRPKANGLCERTNQTIEGILRTMIREESRLWDDALPYAMMAYRATEHKSTGYTPNMLVYGRETMLPSDILFGQTNVPPKLDPFSCYCDYINWLRSSMVRAFARARELLGISAKRQKYYHDEDTAPRHFKLGDWVSQYHPPTGAQTLHTGWKGPYVVCKKIGAAGYIIKENQHDKDKIAHSDELKLYYDQSKTNWVREELARRASQSRNEKPTGTWTKADAEEGQKSEPVKKRKRTKK